MVSECDRMMKIAIPAVRIAVAKSLNRFGMSQSEIAKRLGVAQAAVSKYLSTKYSKRISDIEKFVESRGLQKGIVNLITANRGDARVQEKIDQIASGIYLMKSAIKLSK